MSANSAVEAGPEVPVAPTANVHETTKLARETKRVVDHKHKWKLTNMLGCDTGKPGPYRIRRGPLDRTGTRADAEKAFARHHPTAVVDSATAYDDIDPPRRCSCDWPEPVLDAGIAYSFDHYKGPSDGSDVLTAALSKAVERVEDKKTKDLVDNEYDVVSSDDDDDHLARGKAVEEDFEMLGPF